MKSKLLVYRLGDWWYITERGVLSWYSGGVCLGVYETKEEAWREATRHSNMFGDAVELLADGSDEVIETYRRPAT